MKLIGQRISNLKTKNCINYIQKNYGFNLSTVKKLLTKGYSKVEINLLLSFISDYVKFGNDEYRRNLDYKIYEMVEFETTEEILENFLNPVKRLLTLERWLSEANDEADKACLEKEQARLEKEQERLEKEREHEKVERSILLMLNQGVKAEIIAKFLEIPNEQIELIQNKYKDNNPIQNILK